LNNEWYIVTELECMSKYEREREREKINPEREREGDRQREIECMKCRKTETEEGKGREGKGSLLPPQQDCFKCVRCTAISTCEAFLHCGGHVVLPEAHSYTRSVRKEHSMI
jgi:hypothetical protein